MLRTLGIETSCDESAVAVVDGDGRVEVSLLSSQIEAHAPYGGVVPELASREHLKALPYLVDQALESALGPVEMVAVTAGPGLIGALLVGVRFAAAFAWGRRLPLVAVDHLEGHLVSSLLNLDGEPARQEPDRVLALVASGGHSSWYLMDHGSRVRLGRTRDDAAGESFDKVAQVLGLGYPGGRVISELAAKGNPDRIKFKRTYLEKSGFDFSFSGIKTGVGRYIELNNDQIEHQAPDIASGFQESVVDVLSYKLLNAAAVKRCNHVALVGGVAANSRLREKVATAARQKHVTVHIPPVNLCGDNAAMIAAAGFHHLIQGRTSALDSDVYSRIKQ